MFAKILVANRGEIACRVMRTARQLGIRTVAIYSDADADALHVQMADEAVHVGGSVPAQSYLAMDKVIAAARLTGAQAIHPGYGFLSENAEFCELCANHDLVFIGPPAAAIRAMGSKSAAKQIMQEANVPLLPGYHGADQNPAILAAAAAEIGYPVLLKAVAGGGGKGMRQVHDPDEFDAALAAARREAQSGFGNDDMLVEKYLQQPRHVEVQVFCDTQGNGVYLFERDCSVQRRHQKVIEEAPAPKLSAELRTRMGEAALRAAAAVDYVGAGTVEFLLDADGQFFFMEMNTRLQVEHPVTEMITGQDLVHWQLLVANGEPLPCQQADLQIHGHAVEARIYAEDPEHDFLPAAGKLIWLQQPEASSHVRVDTGVVAGDEVGVFYDPMIAKLVVWDDSRERALARLAQALSAYRLVGVTTNIDFLKRLATHPAFIQEALSTDFIERHADTLLPPSTGPDDRLVVLAALYLTLRRQAAVADVGATSPWQATDFWRMNAPRQHTEHFDVQGTDYAVALRQTDEQAWALTWNNQAWNVSGNLHGEHLLASVNGHQFTATAVSHGNAQDRVTLFTDTATLAFSPTPVDIGEAVEHADGSGFKAPMNGKIVDILVSSGDRVSAGDTLVIMEAMKMEHAIKAPGDGQVTEIFYAQGDLVDGGTDLLTFEVEAVGKLGS